MRRAPLFQAFVMVACIVLDAAFFQAHRQGYAQVPAAPSSPASSSLPVGTLNIEGRSAAIPDWQVISFDTFPPFSTDGRWGEVAWSQGDRLDDVLTLGDFQGSLDLHLLTLASIGEARSLQTDLGRENPIYQVPLDQFGLLERQTIASLVAAVPALLEMPIADLPPIQALVGTLQPTLRNGTLESLLAADPELGEIELTTLEGYQVADLPGIEQVPLQSFSQWEEAAISEIPLLSEVSWWLFPRQPQLDGEIATLEIDPSANSLELVPQAGFESTEWTVAEERESVVTPANPQGRSQLNDGKELDGAVPFGPIFKIVPAAVTPQGVEMVMYFRTCRQVSLSLDCSAYGIGPIPFRVYRPGENIFLGDYTFAPAASLPTTPPGATSGGVDGPEIVDSEIDSAAQRRLPVATRLLLLLLAFFGGMAWWWRAHLLRLMAKHLQLRTRPVNQEPEHEA